MAVERQLWLIEPPRPLRIRLGDAFFAAVPALPGVYLMSGKPHPTADERLLYVGKSVNLRRRLQAYGSTLPGRHGKRLTRLVSCVDHISWEVCASGTDALLRENELLRRHRPLFNRVNTWPDGYWFVSFQWDGQTLELRLTHRAETSGRSFGAFKSAEGYRALIRLFWALTCARDATVHVPGLLFDGRVPRRWRFALAQACGAEPAGRVVAALRAYLNGASSELVPLLARSVANAAAVSRFQRQWQEAALETLQEFYERGPNRNRRLREQFVVSSQLIPADELDDLLVLGPSGPAIASEPPPS